MITNAVNLTETEYLLPGNRTCPGCALSIAYRHILKALEGKVIVTVPASCLTVLHGMYPITSVNVPCVNTPFASTAASAAGLAAGLHRGLRQKARPLGTQAGWHIIQAVAVIVRTQHDKARV